MSEPIKIERGERGLFWCPFHCSGPNVGSQYSERHWATEDGVRSHLEGRRGKPCPLQPPDEDDVPELPAEVTEKPRQIHSRCPDCDAPIMELETVWMMGEKIVCMECHGPYRALGEGHMDAAGLTCGGFLEVA